MSIILISIAFGAFGLLFGSFAGATVWRLRAAQLREDEAAGEKVPAADKKQVKELERHSVASDRSRCLHCGHRLAWYELIPLVSWAVQRGKCRHCHKPIGVMEPLIELGMAAFFVVSFLVWPYSFSDWFGPATLALWLAAGVGLGILFAYDAKWFLLPNKVMFTVIGIGALYSLLILAHNNFSLETLQAIALSCVIMSGFYFVVYLVSKGTWIGFGDVKLGLALALLLADWQLALLALFVANLVGALLLIPLMALGKIKRQAHVPFGPLFITGWLAAGLFGSAIIKWYIAFTLGLL